MPLTDSEIKQLQQHARQLRLDIIDTTVWAGGAHIGGSLSMAEILVLLYFKVMKIDPKRPDWTERDRLVLSKGHGGVGLASVLAQRGYYSKELLREVNTVGSKSADAEIAYAVVELKATIEQFKEQAANVE